MIINDLLKENGVKLTEQLADIMIVAIKQVYPTFYESCEFQNWSNFKIVNHAFNIDLPEEDVDKLLGIAARCAKIWAFS